MAKMAKLAKMAKMAKMAKIEMDPCSVGSPNVVLVGDMVIMESTFSCGILEKKPYGSTGIL